MKTEQYKDLEKKYLEGKTTSEEEKFLKEMSADSWFQTLKDEKSEKMDWSFEEFLEEAENQKVIPITSKKSTTLPKLFWMAASLVVLFGLYLSFKYFDKDKVTEQDNLAQQQIKEQKNDFINENQVAQIADSSSINTNTENPDSDSATSENIEPDANEVMNKILPKRGRIKRVIREKYASNGVPKEKKSAVENSDYNDNYVIINGQKIENEQEAIDLTEYSFRMLSNKMAQTIASTNVIENVNPDN